jgi:hypothetical protein
VKRGSLVVALRNVLGARRSASCADKDEEHTAWCLDVPLNSEICRQEVLETNCMCERTFLSIGPQFPKEHCSLEGSQASPVDSSGKSNV